jgi:hypothetical protein
MTTALTTQTNGPMETMIQRAFEKAIEQGAGIEVVDRILAQQREMIDYNDRLAFNDALRRIQDKLKPIVKDDFNQSTNSKFATAKAVDRAIEDLMAEERMSLTFEPEPTTVPEMVRIVGVLSLGAYSKRYPLDMPADGKGAKGGGVMSRTHATGAAITYAKRYLKNMIFNLRFEEVDDDGNGASALPAEVFLDHMNYIRDATTAKGLTEVFVAAYKDAEKIMDKKALGEFIAAKAKRKKELETA